MPNDLPELTVESRTQSVPQIQSYMQSKGFDDFETTEASDALPAQAETEEESAQEQAENSEEAAEAEQEETAEEDQGEGEGEPEPPPAKGADKAKTPPPAGKPAAAKPAVKAPAQAEGEPHLSRRARARMRDEAERNELRKQYEADLQKRDQEIADLRKGFEELRKAGPAKAAAEADPEPKYQDFADAEDPHAEYTKALSRWAYREEKRKETQREKPAEKATAEHRTTDEKPTSAADSRSRDDSEQRKWQARWNAQIEVSKATNAGCDEVMSRQQPKPIASRLMSTALMEREEDGAELLYWLASHPDQAHEMALETELGDNPNPRKARQVLDRIHEQFDALNVFGDDDQAEDSVRGAEEEAEPASREARDVRTRAASPPPPQSQPQPPAQRSAPGMRPADQIRQRQAAAQQEAAPQNSPRPKMEPPKPLGSRAVTTRKRVDEMTKSDFARLGDGAADEYRRLREGR